MVQDEKATLNIDSTQNDSNELEKNLENAVEIDEAQPSSINVTEKSNAFAGLNEDGFVNENFNNLSEIDTEPKWYVLHTYSGYENMVEQNIRKMIETNNIQNLISEIVIPVEDDIIEKPNGKKKVVEKKKFPGYVFIKMVHTRQMWYLVTSTRGVTGFVGPSSRAVSLTKDEVKRMGLEKVALEEGLVFSAGDNIKVISGALEGFVGKISSVAQERKKAKVIVSMFGRDTIVDLGFDQIDKILS